jgi:hypothetical protein
MVKEEENKTSLYYSKLDQTIYDTYKGKKAGQIVNSGNGYTVTLNSGFKILLDYCEACELTTLLEEVTRKSKRKAIRWVRK